jgi:hypothetical protein
MVLIQVGTVGEHCHPSGATSRPGAHAGRLMGVKGVLDALSDRQSKQIVGRRQRDRRPETVADRDLGVVAAVAAVTRQATGG